MRSVTPVAAIDCGTNSIRLLIAEPDGAGSLRDLVRRIEVVRLGYGVDRTGVIDPAAMQRTLAACDSYAADCRAHGVERIRFVATSASRDARNADEFVDGVKRSFAGLTVEPEVVSGSVEADLSFTGATGDIAAAGHPGPYLVVDLGGGSTEFVRGAAIVEQSLSLDMGSVRMTERYLHTDPPTAGEIALAEQAVDALLDGLEEHVELHGIGTVVGLGGSITTLTAHALGLAAYEPDRVHLAAMSLGEAHRAAGELLRMPRAARSELGFMHPGRVDVIGAGALIWRQALGRVERRSPGARVVTSEHDILDGAALSLL